MGINFLVDELTCRQVDELTSCMQFIICNKIHDKNHIFHIINIEKSNFVIFFY